MKIIGKFKNERLSLLNTNYILIYILIAFIWYTITAQSINFNVLVNYVYHIANSILDMYFFSENVPITQLLVHKFYLSGEIIKFLYLLITIFILIGIFDILLRRKSILRPDSEYFIISMILFSFLGISFVGRFSEYMMGPFRLYQLTSTFLAPFCIIGGVSSIENITKVLKVKIHTKWYLRFFSVFMTIFLLFNSGVAPVLMNEYPNALPIYYPEIIHSNPYDKEKFYRKYPTIYDVASAQWIGKYRKSTIKIYSDDPYKGVLFMYITVNSSEYVGLYKLSQVKYVYVHLRYFNVLERLILKYRGAFTRTYTFIQISNKFNKYNKIYTNSGSNIFYKTSFF